MAAEQKLRAGQLKVLVATSSLEMGIDVGFIDLVVQMGSPRHIRSFLQRIGRSGHGINQLSRGICYGLTKDEIAELAALLRGVRNGALEDVVTPRPALDVLMQQVVAEVLVAPQASSDLLAWVRQAWPYRDLTEETFYRSLRVLAEGFEPGQRRRALIVWDQESHLVTAKPYARAMVHGNAGTIPESGDYPVVDGGGQVVGSVNEDFAVESARGDIFALGNMSWRIEAVRQGKVQVSDAHGAAPTIPFWLGEVYGRSDSLSTQVSLLRENWSEDGFSAEFLAGVGIAEGIVAELAKYFRSQSSDAGFMPSRQQVYFEHFFDDSGGGQLVVHAPYGARINRAWALALRKRFCRQYNFELQAAAVDDGFILSLGRQQGVDIEGLFGLLTVGNAKHYVVQAVLDSPIFESRWRWVSNRSLAVARRKFGQRVPPFLQRIKSDDLLTGLFPMATACLENITGDIEPPDHPLVDEALNECLYEALDLPGLEQVLADYAAGKVCFTAIQSPEPSPFAMQMVKARPYAFLDDEELQNRRVNAVKRRHERQNTFAAEGFLLTPEVRDAFKESLNPEIQDHDELRDFFAEVLFGTRSAILGYLGTVPGLDDPEIVVTLPQGSLTYLIAATDKARIIAELPLESAIEGGDGVSEPILVTAVRGWLNYLPAPTADELAEFLGQTTAKIMRVIGILRSRGEVFEVPEIGAAQPHYALRHILRRLQHFALAKSRRPVPLMTEAEWQVTNFSRHGLLDPVADAENSLAVVIKRLQGYQVAYQLWEREILAARFMDFSTFCLDDLGSKGLVGCGRMAKVQFREGRSRSSKQVSMTRATPVSLMLRTDESWLKPFAGEVVDLDYRGRLVFEALQGLGRCYFDELLTETRLLAAELVGTLHSLLASGLVITDDFDFLRRLGSGHAKKQRYWQPRGRFCLWPRRPTRLSFDEWVLAWAEQLLSRYGVVCRQVLQREPAAPGWGALRRALHIMELRGQVQGGRYVAGSWGEQFCQTPLVTKPPAAGGLVIVAASDPALVTGLTPDLPWPQNAERLAFIDGRLVAYHCGGANHLIAADAVAQCVKPLERLLGWDGTTRQRFLLKESYATRG